MSSATAPLKLPELAGGVIDLAEALGVILVAKVNDTLREAIAFEAKTLRTDALHILTDFRKDIECRFRDLNANPTDEPSPPVTAFVSHRSNVTSLSLPMTTFHRNMSLEQRLAAEVFAAKLAERSSQVSKPETRKGQNSRPEDSFTRQSAASSHDERNRFTFDPLIPGEAASMEHMPCRVTVAEYEAPSSSSKYPSKPSIHDQFVVASEDTTSQAKRIDALSPCLQSILQEPSRHTLSLDGNESEHGRAQRLPLSRMQNQISEQWSVEARKFYDESLPSASEVQGLGISLFPMLLRALGIIPWSMQLVWLSRMYQSLLLCCLTASSLSVVTRSFSAYLSEDSDNVFESHVGDILALGTLVSFLAAVWKGRALQDTSWLIESYLSRAGLLERVNKTSCREFWLLCIGSRFYANALALSLSEVGFAISVFVLLAICFYASRVCHSLLIMVEHFCDYMQDNSDFETALEEFFLLHCTIRFASTTLQWSFVVLQLTAIVEFIFCSASIYVAPVIDKSVIVTLIPGVVCEVVLLHLSMRAGLVSDLCARVPMLVTTVNAKLETKRMYLVDYIVHCQAGFHIFEVRLSTSTLLKLFYVAVAAWCGLLTQGLIK